MANTEKNKINLLDCFQQFYTQVIALKRLIQAGNFAAVQSMTHGMESEGDNKGKIDAATAASRCLQNLLEQQFKDVSHKGMSLEVKLYRQAQYIMCVLADEIFLLELSWVGKAGWNRCLLEEQLFGTRRAGEYFYRYLNKLLNKQQPEPLLKELASVYLLALRLGFKGWYRGAANEYIIEKYRGRLLEYIDSYGATKSSAGRTYFTQAYKFTLREGKDLRLAPLMRWVSVAAGAFVVYLVLAHAVWDWAVEPIAELISI